MKIRGTLKEAELDRLAEASCTELERAGIEEKLRTVFRLSLEEILLIWKERLGEETQVIISFRKRNGDLNVQLMAAGMSVNPFAQDSPILDHLLPRFGNEPAWRYEKDRNRVRFVFALYNTTIKNFRFSWKYTIYSRKILAFAAGTQLISVLLGILAPAISARIIVDYTRNEGQRIIYIALALLAVQLLRNLFMVISNQGYNRAYSRTLTELEKDLVNNSLKVESRCIDDKGSGLFIQRITSDTQRIASGFNNIADMLTQILNYFGVLCAMFLAHPMIALFVIAIMGMQYIMEARRTKRLYRDDRIFRTANERFSGMVGEMVRGAKDVKLLNCEEQFAAELEGRITDANRKRLSMQARSWRAKFFRWEFGEFGTFALIVLMAWLITNGKMIPAVALVLYNYYTEVGPNAIKTIGSFMDSIADFNISNERIHALLNSPEFPREEFGDTVLADPKGEIRFEHVRFSYHPEEKNARLVLKDMCFTIQPGEMIGLVGKSGCGKSTTFHLLSRLYTPTGGRILLDGYDIQTLTKDSVRNNMTVVSQNPYIFRMSVRDNLKIVKKDLTEEEMREVCRQACIAEDIENMPEGYDTLIGEGGVNLSGGQRQRLAIARGLLRNSRIILFDEATSALDNATQAKIQQAIDNTRQGRTVVIIAHRLSTIVNADRILYMEDGRVMTEGTHAELMESCEAYRKMAQAEKKSGPDN